MEKDTVARIRNECQCSDDCRAVNDPCIPMQAADEIERLQKIIRDFYFEEEKYQDYLNQDFMEEYATPQSWKDAYTAFEKEARRIEFGDE